MEENSDVDESSMALAGDTPPKKIKIAFKLVPKSPEPVAQASTSSVILSGYASNIDFGENTEVAPVNEGYPVDSPYSSGSGYASPSTISSQGSLSSGEYLFGTVEKIEKRQENYQKGVQSLSIDMALPKDEQRLLEKFMRDPQFLARLVMLSVNELKSYCLVTGIENTDAAKNLLRRFESEESNVISARLGRQLMEPYCSDCKNGNICSDEKLMVGNLAGEVPLETLDKNTKTSAPFVSGRQNDDNEENMEIETNDDIGNSNVPSFLNASNINSEMRSGTLLSLPNVILDKAFDHVVSGKIEKAGKVLFDHVFTPEEILNCTLGGKKGTRRFDQEKVRLMNRAISWMLLLKEKKISTPKTHAALSAHIDTNDTRLSKEDADKLDRKVFTEYAYSRRKLLNSSPCCNVEVITVE